MLNLSNKILCSNCFAELSADCDHCDVCSFDTKTYTPDPGVLAAGTILLGKYVVGKVLGRGGFGITYLGYDINNDKKVAIKEYLPEGLAYRNPDSSLVSTYPGEKEEYYKNGAEKFYEEAKTVSKFNGHPNIVNVYEFFYENNTAYFVMEYIEGVDFKHYLAQKGGRISSEEAVELLKPVMDALMIVHSTGLLHRDVSPDNIYITNTGDLKLLDFGAARQILGEKSKSLSVILKQGYAPLEQYQKNGNQGPWSDIYALGATIYYAICGRTPDDVMSRVYVDELKMPSQMGFEIPESLEMILRKMLAVKESERYQSIIDLKHDLNYFVEKDGEPKKLQDVSDKENKKGKTNRRFHLTNDKKIILALLTIVIVAGGIICCLVINRNTAHYSVNNQPSSYSKGNAGLTTSNPTSTPAVTSTPMPTQTVQATTAPPKNIATGGNENKNFSILGTWKRQNANSDLDGTVVRVETTNGDYQGVVIGLESQAAISLGFKIGDIKWQNIIKEKDGLWSLQDLWKGSSGSSRVNMYMQLDYNNKDILYITSVAGSGKISDNQKWIRLSE